AIRGEGAGLALVLRGLFDLGDEQRPAERWREGGDEEPVVAPGQDGRDRAGGEAPDPVGTEPLPRLARRQILRELRAPVEHHPCSTSPVRTPCAIRASRAPRGDPGPPPQYDTGAPSAGSTLAPPWYRRRAGAAEPAGRHAVLTGIEHLVVVTRDLGRAIAEDRGVGLLVL